MAAITIDETARFVSMLSFKLSAGDVSAMAREVQSAVERHAADKQGFIGCLVMANAKEPHLCVVSIWESGHAWSAAQYDEVVGRVVSDVVETAKSYEIQTYETVAVVRA